MRFLFQALSVFLVLGSVWGRRASTSSSLKAVLRVTSTTASGDKLTPRDDIPFNHATPEKLVIEINRDVTYQQIVGFGGAITEASTTILQSLPENLVDQILQAYYSENGLRYTMGRIHMNSCDFSLSSYSFDNVDGDFALSKFDTSLQHNIDNNMIPILQRINELTNHKLRLFFSPWSPPAWMKSNNQMTGSNNPCLKPGSDYAQAWANYYVSFVRAHAQYNISFWGLTVQNEPEFAAPWEACTYTPEQERDFIKFYLGPTLHKNGLDNLNVMIHDHNKDHVLNFAKVILSDPEAAKYVWGTGLHWYSGDEFENVNATHFAFPSHHIYATEACHCPFAWNEFARGEKYAHDIIGDLNHYAEGWNDWNIVLNGNGGPNHLGNNCDSPILAESSWPDIHYQPMFYALGHFSKFLPPSSSRVQWKLWQGVPTPKSKATDNTRVSASNAPILVLENGVVQTDDVDTPLEFITFVARDSAWHTASYNEAPTTTTKSSSSFANDDEKVVIVVLNSSDNATAFSIPYTLSSGKVFANVQVEPHSILTLTADARLF